MGSWVLKSVRDIIRQGLLALLTVTMVSLSPNWTQELALEL